MTSKQSRIISKVLSPAVRLWLRSQVEQVEDLQVNIEAGDRHLFTGQIPRISLSALSAVYQGLHLSKIQLLGENIQINLRQIIKGQPFRLLEPVPVSGQLLLQETDLKASLQSSLLSTGLTQLLAMLLKRSGLATSSLSLKEKTFSWEKVVIEDNQFILGGSISDSSGNTTPILISAGLQLASSQELQIDLFHLELPPEFPPVNLDSFKVDLGSQVALENLKLAAGQIFCRGRLTIMP